MSNKSTRRTIKYQYSSSSVGFNTTFPPTVKAVLLTECPSHFGLVYVPPSKGVTASIVIGIKICGNTWKNMSDDDDCCLNVEKHSLIKLINSLQNALKHWDSDKKQKEERLLIPE